MIRHRGHMISTGLGVVSLIPVRLLPQQTAYAGAESTQHEAPSTEHHTDA